MVTLTSGQLVWTAIALLVAGWLLSGPAQRSRVVAAIRNLAFVVAVAATLAAVIMWVAPAAAAGLTSETLVQLNEATREFRHLAEKWTWVAIVLAGLSLATLAFAGWVELTSKRAVHFHRFAVTAAAAKVVLAIVATGTFVASGFAQRSQETVREAANTAERLAALQYTVFSKVAQATRLQVVQAVLAAQSTDAAASAAASLVAPTHAAFNAVAPYMQAFDRIPVGATTPKGSSSFGRAGVAAAAPPDISTENAEDLGKAFDADENSRPRDRLAEDISAVAFDMNASEAIRDHLLHIENPIISEMVAAFIDPVILEPLRKLAGEKAMEVFNKHLSPSDLTASIAAAATSLALAFGPRLDSAAGQLQSNDRSELGVPVWAKVRNGLSKGVARGLNGKSQQVQDAARSVVKEFSETWSAANMLYQGDGSRTLGAERTFGSYLEAHPDYAALWGYAVIGLAPGKYREQLGQISQDGFLESKKLKTLREVLPLAAAGNQRLIQTLKRFGIEGKYSNDAYTDTELAKRLYESHGAYPVDGYMLYSLEWKGRYVVFDSSAKNQLKSKRSYFVGPDVSRAVARFCPAEGE